MFKSKFSSTSTKTMKMPRVKNAGKLRVNMAVPDFCYVLAGGNDHFLSKRATRA